MTTLGNKELNHLKQQFGATMRQKLGQRDYGRLFGEPIEQSLRELQLVADRICETHLASAKVRQQIVPEIIFEFVAFLLMRELTEFHLLLNHGLIIGQEKKSRRD